MKQVAPYVVLFALGASASTRALAEDPLRFYVGAGAGESHVRTDREVSDPFGAYNGPDYRFDGRHSAWKVIAGIRPVSPLGVELEYIDFGNPRTEVMDTFSGALTGAEAKAVTLFGLGYLPLPVPFLDVYGKLGLARLHTTLTEISPVPFCPVGVIPCAQTTSNQSGWSTNFAYGAGVQVKVSSLAVRAEYERIDASAGNPDILSLGVTWTF
jgi:opacity protein-like surface antigen